jgi:FkbM family methyltransferase
MKGDYRFGILHQSLFKKRLGGSFGHWVLNCLGPGRGRAAKQFIRRMEKTASGWEIEIKDVEGILFADSAVSRNSVNQSLYEQLYPWHWHYYQIPQTRVTEQDTVFDCGCAEGMFTFLNASVAKKIVCFEPLPEFLVGLRKTFYVNPKIEIVPAALGDRCQNAFLRRDALASAITTTPTDTPVDLITIDAYCNERNCQVTYIKADLEGYEMNMLKGAAETIKKFRPKIAITTYHLPSHATEIEIFLKGLIPSYNILTKGVTWASGSPMMLHAW